MRIPTLLSFFVTLAASLSAATYYVDSSGGSDTNPGTSKSAPWRHHPYMQGWTGNYSHQAGDRFIFKGGVTWTASSFSMNITSSGASGNPDYYGVDQTWFAGTSWSRPTFDLQGLAPTGGKAAIQVNASYVTIDNLEIKNLFIPGGDTFAASSISIVYQHDILIQNCLIHNWTTNSSTDDQMGGVTSVGAQNVTVDHCTIYGTLVNGNKTMGACTFNASTVQYSTLYNCSNGVFGSTNVHDNSIHDIGQSNDSSYHENAMEVGGSGTVFVYNNLVYNCNHGTCIYPNPGNGSNVNTTIYVYNNVVYNSAIPDIEVDMWGETSAVSSLYVYGNTLQCPGGDCVRIVPPQSGGAPLTNLVVRNNHYISDNSLVECWNNAGGNSSCGAVTNPPVDSNNITMSMATATSQGYTANNAYAPAGASALTRSAGMNLAGNCPSVGAPLCSDTSDGNTRATDARPASGAWDAGAYQFGGSTAPTPSLSGVTCSPSSFVTPGTATCTVTLTSSAPSSGTTVALSSSNSLLSVPSVVMVSSGAQSASFPVSATTTSSNAAANVTATLNGASLSFVLSLLAPAVTPPPVTPPSTPSATLTGFSLSSSSVTSGTSLTGTVTLSAPAPAGGIAVAVSSSNSAIASDASSQVMVPQGATSATIGIVCGTDSVSTGVVLSASYGGATVTANLTVNPVSVPTAPTTSGLVAAYSFNEGTGTQVIDKSGNGNTGVITGATWTSSGRFGSALSFDGTSSWVTVKDSAVLDLKQSVTLEAWVYPKTLTGWQAAVIKEQTGGLSYALYANSNPGTPVGAVHTTSDVNLYGGAGLQLNTWSHLAVTYNGSALNLYVNGILVNSQSVSGQMPVSPKALRIGGDSVWGEYFNGLIDEVRVYNRALSAAQIAADMKAPL